MRVAQPTDQCRKETGEENHEDDAEEEEVVKEEGENKKMRTTRKRKRMRKRIMPGIAQCKLFTRKYAT